MSIPEIVRAIWPKGDTVQPRTDQHDFNVATLSTVRSLEQRVAQLEERHNAMELELASKVELLAGQLNDLLHSKGAR